MGDATPALELIGRYTAQWSPTEWLTVATWMLIVSFVGIEMFVITRSEPDQTGTMLHEGRTAAAMAGGAVVVGVAYGAVFASAWSSLGRFAPGALVGFWQQNPVLTALCAFVAWDFSGWIYHLIGHHSALGWAAHSPHHSGSRYDATLALRLTWMPWHGLAHHPLLALVGFPFEVILGCLAVSNAMQALQHSSTMPAAPRWLSAVVMTPEAHRHHHTPEGARVNLGPVLTIWDGMAGTWRAPWTEPPKAHQHPVAQTASESGAWRTELAGWRRLVAGRGSPG